MLKQKAIISKTIAIKLTSINRRFIAAVEIEIQTSLFWYHPPKNKHTLAVIIWSTGTILWTAADRQDIRDSKSSSRSKNFYYSLFQGPFLISVQTYVPYIFVFFFFFALNPNTYTCEHWNHICFSFGLPSLVLNARSM